MLDEVTIYILIPFIFLCIIICIWYKYGKDYKIKNIKRETPPKNINVLEFSFLYKNEVTYKDYIPFIIDLCNKGYIKVIKYKNRYKLLKIENSKDEIEKYFMDELFKSRTEIYLEKKKNKIILIMNSIRIKLISKQDVKNIFEEKSLSKKTLTKFIIFIIYGLVVLKLTIYLRISTFYAFFIILFYIGSKILSILFYNKKIYIKLIGLFLGSFLIALPFIILIIYNFDINYVLISLTSMFLIFIMIVFNALMPKKRKSIVKLLSEIKGFKEFLNSEEVIDKIISNKISYYELLPYSYIFEINKKWSNLKKDLKIQNPIWYEES